MALHTGEWKETVYSVSADVLDGVSVCVCVFISHSLPKAHENSPQSTLHVSLYHTNCLPKLSSQSILTISPKNTSCLPVQHYLSPSTTLPVSPKHTVSPYHSVCLCCVFFFMWLTACLTSVCFCFLIKPVAGLYTEKFILIALCG